LSRLRTEVEMGGINDEKMESMATYR